MLGILNMFCIRASLHVEEPLRLLEKSLVNFLLLPLKALFPDCHFFFPSEPMLVKIKFSYI